MMKSELPQTMRHQKCLTILGMDTNTDNLLN